MAAPPTRRIILLGKAGAGKSSLGNTILGETVFKINQLLFSQRSKCQAESKLVRGRNIALIDMPGFFGKSMSEADMQSETLQCIVESSPGPHAFVLVLKVEGVTDQEKEVISKMCQFFSEEALRYTVVVFTHGDQLPEGMKIEEFVSQSEGLFDLVKKCGGRCHVVDNKYWKSEAQSGYRSNQLQVEELLNTIDKIVADNKGGHYTNKLLQEVETEMKEEEATRQKGNACQKETRKKTKSSVYKKNVAKLANVAGEVLMLALLGSETALLISTAKAVTKESAGEEKPPAGAAAEQAPATPGNKVLAGVIKGGEVAKSVAGFFSLAKILGAKDDPAKETPGEQKGETTGSSLGAATEDTVDGAAAASAAEGIAEASAEGAAEMAAAAEGVGEMAAAAEGVGEMAAAAEGLSEGGEAVATVMAAAEAAAEACCIQ